MTLFFNAGMYKVLGSISMLPPLTSRWTIFAILVASRWATHFVIKSDGSLEEEQTYL